MTLRAPRDLPANLELLPDTAPWIEASVGLGLLALAALAAHFIVKHIILRLVGRIVPGEWPTPSAMAGRLAHIVPALLVSHGTVLVPHLPPWVATGTRHRLA